MHSYKISFIIKALNEENKIASCIQSCLKASENFKSEIILVDSVSEDKTVEIAKSYPIKIVQFTHVKDRSCGAAAELGYQCSTGDYLFFIDGDMELEEGFVEGALSILLSDERIAGVGGIIRDNSSRTYSDRKRIEYYDMLDKKVEVSSLGGGGLYRRSAIEVAGCFANSELKACEELDLGIRLRNKGFKMYRLPSVSVNHTGHSESTFQMYQRLWSTGRLTSYAVLLRSFLGTGMFFSALLSCWFAVVPMLSIVLGSTLCFFVGMYNASMIFALVWLGIVLLLSIKKKSISSGVLSVFSWWIIFISSFGVLRKIPNNRKEKIEFVEL